MVYNQPTLLSHHQSSTPVVQACTKQTLAGPLLCAAALKESQTAEAWGQGAQAGLDAIQHYGGAKLGDRTMLDALSPAIDSFRSQSQSGIALPQLVHSKHDEHGLNLHILSIGDLAW